MTLDPTAYKAITIYEPWAMLIRVDLKRWETRSWQTPYRGPILIHAGRSIDYVDILGSARFASHVRRGIEEAKAAGQLFLSRTLHPGCVVARALLVDCRPTRVVAQEIDDHERAFGDFGAGRFAWKLESVTPLPDPLPWRGMQGLWTPPATLVAAVEAQIGKVAS